MANKVTLPQCSPTEIETQAREKQGRGREEADLSALLAVLLWLNIT